MNVVVAVDSFKGSISSLEAGNAVADGIKSAIDDANVSVRPIADGGEGTVEAITYGMKGELNQVEVLNPLLKRINCDYGIIDLEEGKTAVIEMAAASGITLIDESDRNPYYTTTYGLGEVIIDAVKKGCRRFLIGIGGSATNDCGAGMLQALGFGLLDSDGNQIKPGAIGLKDIVAISTDNVIKELKDCVFKIACDVSNPLCGENGCSAVFGPQKGASPEMVQNMDAWVKHFSDVAREKYEHADTEARGAGAAGGLGFAFLTFTNAVLESGISIVLKETKLEEYIKEADIVVTGEGRLDGQTAMGKAPIGVANIAKKYGKTVIAFAGCVTEDATVCNENGIDAYFPILRNICGLSEAMDKDNAYKNLKATSCQVFRLISQSKN